MVIEIPLNMNNYEYDFPSLKHPLISEHKVHISFSGMCPGNIIFKIHKMGDGRNKSDNRWYTR